MTHLAFPAQSLFVNKQIEEEVFSIAESTSNVVMPPKYAPRPDITYWVHPQSALDGSYTAIGTGDSAPKLVDFKFTRHAKGKEVTKTYDDGYTCVMHYRPIPDEPTPLPGYSLCPKNLGPDEKAPLLAPTPNPPRSENAHMAAERHHCEQCYTVAVCQSCHNNVQEQLKKWTLGDKLTPVTTYKVLPPKKYVFVELKVQSMCLEIHSFLSM